LLFLLFGIFAEQRALAGPDTPQQSAADTQKFPWMNKSLSPDERADLVLKEMTLDEKIQLLHGNGMPGWAGEPRPNHLLGNGGAGDA
jgi:beta-glucosidase